MEGSGSIHSGKKIPKKEIKPGYVLNEDLLIAGGMRQGRVLTYADIEAIMNSPEIGEVDVLTLDDLKAKADTVFHTGSNVPDVAPVAEEEYARSLFDPYVANKIKHNVEIKMNRMRGENYAERLDSRRQNYSKLFQTSINTAYSQQKISALESIEHQSRSEADFEGLKALDGVSLPEMLAKLRWYEQNAAMFMDAALSEKRVYTSLVEEIATDMVGNVGYNLQMALLAAFAKGYRSIDFIVSHSLQVMLVSMVSAIELTRIMTDKAARFAETDIETLIAINRKSFTLEELTQLGVAALLHDIALKRDIPDMTQDTEFSIQQDSVIQLHPSNSFHITKMLPIDYEVQRAVYQHHERFDGTGYPSAISPRFYTKFTPILMFAESYIEQTTRNPFIHSPRTPRNVLVDMLSKDRTRYDGDVIYAFLHAASLFPVGSWVSLSDERVGMVIDVNRNDLAKPIVKVLFDRHFEPVEWDLVDLARSPLSIARPIDYRIVQQYLKSTEGDYYIRAVAAS